MRYVFIFFFSFSSLALDATILHSDLTALPV